MDREALVYITAMQDGLKRKYEVMERILEMTKEQEVLVSQEVFDMDAFDETLEEKELLIYQMQELDKGFQGVYSKMKGEIEANKQQYKPRILELQNSIRQITDLGVKIQALEQKNKTKFDFQAAKKRQEIQGFRVNNRTANVYNQHMTNQHQQWQSYFLDKKQ